MPKKTKKEQEEDLRRLLDTLRKESRTVLELLKITEVKNGKPGKRKKFEESRKTLYNRLNKLKKRGLVYVKGGVWHASESKPPELGTKEYEKAAEHAYLLIFSDEDRVPLTNYPMHHVLQLLVTEDEECKEFLSHLRTGYPKVYDRIEDYRKALKKKGRIIKRLYEDLELGSPPTTDDLKINFTIPTAWALSHGLEEIFKDEELRENDKKLNGLLKDIAGELSLIFHQVALGPMPLRGFCECCPHLNVRTKK